MSERSSIGVKKGSRKFTVAMVALVMTFILALPVCGVVDGGQWVAASGLIVGLFGGANAAVHATASEKKERDAPIR